MSKKEKIYNFTMAILAIISIILVILDYASVINLDTGVWMWVDNGILVVFAIDYFYRLTIAENKWSFFKHNIFDLLSIIPVNGFFTLFRLARLGRLARLARLTRLLRVLRLVGLTGRLRKILYTNGLIYLLYTSLSLLIIGAITYSMTEHVSLAQSFWWAIATATTVGYGDISPHTFVGKIVALVLMLVGIGVIGMLTSSITTYFVREDNKSDAKDVQLEKIMQKLDEIEKQNKDLKEEIQKLKQK
ncbi:ion transporter [Lactobacillus paragasseri]|uniref:ion transporter n=1 Tax=Lactobacillus paragasseri TaxID=2107999 RepID=UPI003219E97F